MRAAGLELQDRAAVGAELHNLVVNPQLSGAPEYDPGYDGASVGAPTRADNRNDQPAPAFDMNAFA